jgi:hypothetical protein
MERNTVTMSQTDDFDLQAGGPGMSLEEVVNAYYGGSLKIFQYVERARHYHDWQDQWDDGYKYDYLDKLEEAWWDMSAIEMVEAKRILEES